MAKTATKTAATSTGKSTGRKDGLKVYNYAGVISNITIYERGANPFARFTLTTDRGKVMENIVAFGGYVKKLKDDYKVGDRCFVNVVYKDRTSTVDGKTVVSQGIIVDRMGRFKDQGAATAAPASAETAQSGEKTTGGVKIEEDDEIPF